MRRSDGLAVALARGKDLCRNLRCLRLEFDFFPALAGWVNVWTRLRRSREDEEFSGFQGCFRGLRSGNARLRCSTEGRLPAVVSISSPLPSSRYLDII